MRNIECNRGEKPRSIPIGGIWRVIDVAYFFSFDFNNTLFLLSFGASSVLWILLGPFAKVSGIDRVSNNGFMDEGKPNLEMIIVRRS